MVAPIGLIPSTRDPATLALSTLAEVVESYHQHFGFKT
jgi:xanthine dehydrogenase accessory factor